VLRDAQLAAALTKPWVLPPILGDAGGEDDQELPENFQSIGSRGVTNLEGELLLTIAPPGQPMFEFVADPSIEFDPEVDPEQLHEFAERLTFQAMLTQAMLESGNSGFDKRGRRRRGLRTVLRTTISRLLIIGDALIHVDDDLRLRGFRFDQYVTRRDTCCDVLYHAIRERLDPLTLRPDQLEAANLDITALRDKTVKERMEDLYTYVEWNPETKLWVTTQEVNGNEIPIGEGKAKREDKPDNFPWINPTAELVEGEHYGRGWVRLNLGELRSNNKLNERLLQFAALASKQHPCIGRGSDVQAHQLMQESGTPIENADVRDGVIHDIAWLQGPSIKDFQIVAEVEAAQHDRLKQAMLIASPRDSERTTATEVVNVDLKEIEGSLGGFYAPIAEELQAPLAIRARNRLIERKLIENLRVGGRDTVEIKVLTGLAALARQIEGGKLQAVIGQLSTIAPALRDLPELDRGIVIDLVLRYNAIQAPGLRRPQEEVERDIQRALAAQAQQAGAEQGARAAADIAVNQARGAA
jgi:hypothetical protein